MALAREITVLEEIDEKEAKRVWQVAKGISGSESARRVCSRWGKQAALEDIDGILQTHENSEALLYALFNYTASCVNKAFRYGYYAALEDEAD